MKEKSEEIIGYTASRALKLHFFFFGSYSLGGKQTIFQARSFRGNIPAPLKTDPFIIRYIQQVVL